MDDNDFFEYDDLEEDDNGYPDPKEMKENDLPEYNILTDESDQPVNFVKSDVYTSASRFLQARQIHRKGVYAVVHPKYKYPMKHNVVHHIAVDPGHREDEKQLKAFAMHKDPYFRRENLCKVYARSSGDKCRLGLHRNSQTVTALGVSFNNIVGGIFSTAREIGATVQQFLPFAQLAGGHLAPTPNMFLKSKSEYYKSLVPKYNGILYPYSFLSGHKLSNK